MHSSQQQTEDPASTIVDIKLHLTFPLSASQHPSSPEAQNVVISLSPQCDELLLEASGCAGSLLGEAVRSSQTHLPLATLASFKFSQEASACLFFDLGCYWSAQDYAEKVQSSRSVDGTARCSRIMALSAKPKDPSSISRTHKVEEELFSDHDNKSSDMLLQIIN